MKSAPRLIERKLGRERALGQHEFGTRRIEVDPRQRSRTRLDTVVHECLHYIFPRMAESTVARAARAISATLWLDRYRRVER